MTEYIPHKNLTELQNSKFFIQPKFYLDYRINPKAYTLLFFVLIAVLAYLKGTLIEISLGFIFVLSGVFAFRLRKINSDNVLTTESTKTLSNSKKSILVKENPQIDKIMPDIVNSIPVNLQQKKKWDQIPSLKNDENLANSCVNFVNVRKKLIEKIEKSGHQFDFDTIDFS